MGASRMRKILSISLAICLIASAALGASIFIPTTNGPGYNTTLVNPIFAGSALYSSNTVLSTRITTNYFHSGSVDPTFNGWYSLVFSNWTEQVGIGTNSWMIWKNVTNSQHLSLNDPAVIGNFGFMPMWSLGPSNDVGLGFTYFSTQPLPAASWRDNVETAVSGMFGYFASTNAAVTSAIPFKFSLATNSSAVHVQVWGDDVGNDGLTLFSPLRTFDRAAQVANARGITNIIIGDGTFYGDAVLPTTNMFVRGAGPGLTFLKNQSQSGGVTAIFPRSGTTISDLSLEQFATMGVLPGETITYRNILAPFAANIDGYISGSTTPNNGFLIFDRVDFSKSTFDAEAFQAGNGQYFYFDCIKRMKGGQFVHGLRMEGIDAEYFVSGGTMVLSNHASGDANGNAVFYFPNQTTNVTAYVAGMLLDFTQLSNGLAFRNNGAVNNRVIWSDVAAILPNWHATNDLRIWLTNGLYDGAWQEVNSNGTPYIILTGPGTKTHSSTNPLVEALAPSPSISTNLFVFGTRYTNTVAGGFTGRRGSIGGSVECVGALNSFAQATLQVESPNGITNVWIVGSGGLASQTNTLPLSDDIYPGDKWVFNTNLSGGTATMLRSVYKSH